MRRIPAAVRSVTLHPYLFKIFDYTLLLLLLLLLLSARNPSPSLVCVFFIFV